MYIEFLLKLMVFTITLYYLFDYILNCNVNNSIGLSFIFLIIISVFIFRIYMIKKKEIPLHKNTFEYIHPASL